MSRMIISAAARRDIRRALEHSARRWGPEQRRRSGNLIGDGLKALFDNPRHPASRARDDIMPCVRTYHIAKPGRPGRHLIVYRIGAGDSVQVIRLLHDAMDLEPAFSRP
ncbi:MAG: type II toxin-antitoxin system RelE/ParE family toxin [Thiohalocapsa sp.]|uniref:type II toxin-antitoxin system RelE/ParE family toxin n=1 Tax=Thiohalocapsa sp. TaxID=2497641 RepID=UPI0025EED1E7|nr:type II toxin-antitoxin system RelE/ParE family toxin [Thiohalocapsa sp.]MCG6941683.1 type II toxin-antitoxin system RelE/ParE family toxin [Thiohalocapsa sp.]